MQILYANYQKQKTLFLLDVCNGGGESISCFSRDIIENSCGRGRGRGSGRWAWPKEAFMHITPLELCIPSLSKNYKSYAN